MLMTQPMAGIHLEAQGWKESGEGEIRTLDTLAGIPVFETGAFGHSATSPYEHFPCSPGPIEPWAFQVFDT